MMLYIHLPFCKQKCKYCAFCSGAFDEDTQRRYVERLIAMMAIHLPERQLKTVYIGGGTPSVLPLPLWEKLLEAIGQYTDDTLEEFTVELNPESTTQALLACLKAGGVDRLSFGVQSLVDSELSAIGRLHSATQARQALRLACRMGFENISADLIYGLPGQTPDSFEQSLSTLLAENITHLSCYNLQIEEGTPLYFEREQLSFPDEEAQMQMYDTLLTLTGRAGFTHYEISNFCKEGCRARHNSGYWTRRDYIGLGAGAHSMIGNVRYSFWEDIDAFISNTEGTFDERIELTAADIREEQIMLGLRTDAGAPLSLLDRQKVGRFVNLGLGEIRSDHLILNSTGFMLSNTIISELL